MRSSDIPYPHRHARPLGALRLHLGRDDRAAPTGTWRPYGRDLTREAPHLVDEFPADHGRIDRLVYAPSDWDVVAEEVFTRRGRIRVGFLPPRDVGGIVLVRLAGAGVLRLRVVWLPWIDVAVDDDRADGADGGVPGTGA